MVSPSRLQELLADRGVNADPHHLLKFATQERGSIPELESHRTANNPIRWSLPLVMPSLTIEDEHLLRVHNELKTRLPMDRPPEAPEQRETFTTLLREAAHTGRLGRGTWNSYLTKNVPAGHDHIVGGFKPLSSTSVRFELQRLPSGIWALRPPLWAASRYYFDPLDLPTLSSALLTDFRHYTSWPTPPRLVISGCPGDFLRLGLRSVDNCSCFHPNGENAHHPLRLLSNGNCYVGFVTQDKTIVARILLYRDPSTASWLLTNHYTDKGFATGRSLSVLLALTLAHYNPALTNFRDAADAYRGNFFQGADGESIFLNCDPGILRPADTTVLTFPDRLRFDCSFDISCEVEEPYALCEHCGDSIADSDDAYCLEDRDEPYCYDCSQRFGVTSIHDDCTYHVDDCTPLYDDTYLATSAYVRLSGRYCGEYAWDEDPNLVEIDGDYYIEGDPALDEIREELEAEEAAAAAATENPHAD